MCTAGTVQAAPVPSDTEVAALRGVVESAQFEIDQRRLQIQGWSIDSSSSKPPSSWHVRIDGQDAPVLQQRLVSREDVGASLPGTDSREAGFTLEVGVPGDLGWGRHEVSVTAHWGDRQLALPPATTGATSFSSMVVPARHWWIAAIVGGFLLAHLLCTRYFPGPNVVAACWSAAVQRNTRHIAWAVVAIFGMLVAAGVTGLSLQWMVGDAHQERAQSFFTQDSGMRPIALAPRAIRSDEWLVITPSALAQLHHEPPFPIVNRHLGTDGQNMMVIGMTGVPVWHLSALVKPATWGFFVLPLKNALAWYWFFPVFACLLALWGLLNQLAPQRSCRNLALSLVFCAAPYPAGWSQWPLYTTFFAAAAMCALLHMAESTSARKTWLWAALLAACTAGFALVLYPPWQIPLATFCGLLLVGWWLDRRPAPGWTFWIAAILGVAAAFGLIAVWWFDAQDAIAILQNTVYPGGRKALHGGEFPLYWSPRGYSNTDTLSYLGASEVNASEFGGYFLLPVPLTILGWRLAARRSGPHRWQALAWCIFAAWTLTFIVYGVPPWLAKAVFWHVVPSHRVDLALAFSCTVLLAMVPAARADGQLRCRVPAAALTAATLSAALIVAALLGLPAVLYPSLSPVLLIAMTIAGFCMAWWLVQGRIAAATGLTGVIYLCAILGFNPVARGPDHLELRPAIQPFLQATPPAPHGPFKRTLIVGTDGGMQASMSLVAAGVPVVNGVFYYPQFSLWQRLRLPPEDLPVINRYQHLLFDIGAVGPSRSYQARTRSEMSDVVIVTIAAERFDFRASGAEVVLAKEAHIQALSSNPQLTLQGTHAGWAWFAVSTTP